jgi:hypothetical protein
MAEQESKPLSLNDIGTRYEHLMDLKGAIDSVIQILKDKKHLNPDDMQKLLEFQIMAQGIQLTIDSIARYTNYMEEYKLYKTIDSIPSDPAVIEGGRGTPLL